MPKRTEKLSLGSRILRKLGLVRSTEVRQLAKRMRSYYSGAYVGRLTEDWILSPISADQEIRTDLLRLRARSRDLVRNNPYAKRFTGMVSQNIIGPGGIRCLPQVKNTSGQMLKDVNAEILRGWRRWSHPEYATVARNLSWAEAQHLAVKTLAGDGECFIRLLTFDNEFAFAVQFIDADQVDHNFNQAPDGFGRAEIRMGVEIDKYGAPVAYHIFDRNPYDFQFVQPFQNRIRVPAAEMVHLFTPFRIGQSRGVPWLAATMYRLKMGDGYDEAELVAARTAAAKMGFITNAPDADGPVPPPEPLDTSGQGDGVLRRQMEAEPGLMGELGPGQDFKPWDPQHPTAAYEAFTRSCLRAVSSGLDVSYNVLANDLVGVNYSSIRQGLLSERDMWRVLQAYVAEHLHRRVFRVWLRNSLLSGAVQLPSLFAADYEDMIAWMPRGWQWVDPQAEMTAAGLGLANGLTSRTKILASQGMEVEEVFQELAAEEQLAEQYGIDVTPTTGSTGKESSTGQAEQGSGSEGGTKEGRVLPLGRTA